VIEQTHLSSIHAHVLQSFPAEDCGLLSGTFLGHDYVVDAIWPAPNILAHNPGRFEVDPSVRIKVEKICRQRGTRVLGHWHSHPFATAFPSETDRQSAYEPDLVWLILSCNQDGIIETKSFLSPQAQAGLFGEIPVQVIP
jgi:proteasome lid subunit RPN8/RPN11